MAAGGWMMRGVKKVTVGVKPARLWKKSEITIGKRLFIGVLDDIERIRLPTCHELTHAFTASWQLPVWLNEGLALYVMDIIHGVQFIKNESIDELNVIRPIAWIKSCWDQRYIFYLDDNGLVYVYAKGYWLIRYIIETKPEILKEIFNNRLSHTQISKMIAFSYGYSSNHKVFWSNIDQALITHFKK